MAERDAVSYSARVGQPEWISCSLMHPPARSRTRDDPPRDPDRATADGRGRLRRRNMTWDRVLGRRLGRPRPPTFCLSCFQGLGGVGGVHPNYLLSLSEGSRAQARGV